MEEKLKQSCIQISSTGFTSVLSALLPAAPKFVDHLNALSQDQYAAVKAGLDNLGLPYQHDDNLVRGFDYY